MITLNFYLQPQNKYEFHIYFTRVVYLITLPLPICKAGQERVKPVFHKMFGMAHMNYRLSKIMGVARCRLEIFSLQVSVQSPTSFNTPLSGAETINTGIYVLPRKHSAVPARKRKVVSVSSLFPTYPRLWRGGDLH